MFNVLKIMIPVLFIITACASVSLKEETNETLLYPNGDYEACVELTPGRILEYSFEASMPVDFDIHYHVRGKVFYPVKKNRVSAFAGSLDVGDISYYTGGERYFCLMWKNPHRMMNVNLKYKYRVLEKK
jgi:hypothetical protein